jgi:rhodanese-related sulfurtransferase
MDPMELAKRMASGEAPIIIDVRTGFEFRAGHIKGAIHTPLWKILLWLAPLPEKKQTEMVVLCELGPRAVMAKVLLGTFGFRNVSLLSGHMAGWRHSGLPLVK